MQVHVIHFYTHKFMYLPALFSVEYYQYLRATFAEMSHDELDLLVMGQIMAHCYQSTTLQGYHSSSPEERKVTYGQFYHLGQRVLESKDSKTSRQAT